MNDEKSIKVVEFPRPCETIGEAIEQGILPADHIEWMTYKEPQNPELAFNAGTAGPVIYTADLVKLLRKLTKHAEGFRDELANNDINPGAELYADIDQANVLLERFRHVPNS